MTNRLKQGNLEEILAASKDGSRISLLRKSFEGQIIKGLNLTESMFARCSFSGASIYGSTFENCDFVQCDFSSSDLYHLNFKNCRFNSCDFSSSKFDQINIDENCKLNQCKFNNINLADPSSISGINPKDLNIVTEQAQEIKSLIELGFFINDEGTYEFKSLNNPDTGMYVYYDSEAEIYRLTIMSKGIPFITYDLDDVFDYTNIEMRRIVINSLKISIRKANESKDDEAVLKLNSIFNDFSTFKNKNI